MSRTLSELSEGNLQNVLDKSNCPVSFHSASSSAADYKHGHRAMSLLRVLLFMVINLNQLTLTSPETEMKSTKRYKD